MSQRSERDGKMHPCAFLSRRLSRAERNYDVGNRELLAVKLTLEEWRHWLEGAEHPFIVWTDHKNLEFIRKAKRLNSRQARWALFFNRFSFTLFYRPGSRNVKPDVLSRLFDPEPETKQPETILPLNCVVGAVTWPIENEVKQANGGAPSPPGCPNNRLFVPVELRPQVIHWAHTLLLSCHPGIKRTMFMISRRFWWPAMEPEVQEYIEACSVCARNKNSSRARMGLLQPLPIPSRPWSDISIDFVTGLPVSQGNTTVLTVVDRFSKMVKFIALPKLPSAKETAEAMMNIVFRVHGFPKDIVSGAPVCITVLEGVLQAHRSHSQPDIRIPPGCQRPDRTPQPATGNRPPVRGPPEPLDMEQTPGLGRVCAQFIAYISYGSVSLSLCSRLSASFISRQ